MDWIILAGGKSERLRPTFDGPKALIEVAGKTLIERQIDKILPHAIRIIVSLGYKGEDVKEFIKVTYPDEYGTKIICVVEPEPLGTGGALKYVIDKMNVSKIFFLINCDDLTDFDPMDMYTIDGSCIALGNFRCPYGVVHTNGNQVVSFQQKPILKDIWVSIGHYKLYRPEVEPLLKDKCSLEDHIFPKMNLYAYKQRGVWFTINDARQLSEAEEFYAKNNSRNSK